MSELTVLFFAVLIKGACVIAAIAGAVYLASEGKDGWGWLIFLALLLGSGSMKYTNDAEKKCDQVQQGETK